MTKDANPLTWNEPSSEKHERMLLGAMLQSPSVIYDAVETLISDDAFYNVRHGIIYNAILSVFNNGNEVDIPNVAGALGLEDALEAVGGRSYLQNLVTETPSFTDGKDYCQVINDHYLSRSVINNCLDFAYRVSQGLDGGEQAALIGAKKLQDIASEALTERLESSVGQAAEEAYEDYERIEEDGCDHNRIMLGVDSIDPHLPDLSVERLCVFGARPSMGKSQFAAQLALNVASQGHPVLFISLEMSAKSLARRMIANLSGVNSEKLRNPLNGLDEFETELVNDARDRLDKMPLTIRDRGPVDTRSLVNAIRTGVRRHGYRLVVIDYLTLAEFDPSISMNHAVGRFAKDLKRAAVDCGVCVAALAQLNRASEYRTEGRPRLSDLRESGEIEQHADLVGFIHRDWYYWERDRDKEKMQSHPEREFHGHLIISKQRDGPVKAHSMYCDLKTSEWACWEEFTSGKSDVL